MISADKLDELPDPSRPTVPRIAAVPSGEQRPFWSVMIPTYNCASLLRTTLESVLSQAPGPDEMQIEVIDDVSTKDDPESVVREVGGGRVSFFRHPANVGATRNFNSCLQRSRGLWVHTLHGDDFILPGFYAAVRKACEKYPQAGLIATRVFFVDEAGEIDVLTPRVKELESFGQNVLPFTQFNWFQFAGNVLNRTLVEQFGGFDTQLVHTADCEMWIRAVQKMGGVSINRPLACYRLFSGNDTSRLQRTGENLRDRLRMMEVFSAKISGFDKKSYVKQVRDTALMQANLFRELGDLDATAANMKVWHDLTPVFDRMRYHTRTFIRGMRRRLGFGGN